MPEKYIQEVKEWAQRVRILDGVTPVRGFSYCSSQGSQVPFWVKCDQESSRLYGGNKPRKLEFLLGQALSEGFSSVMTSGALGSHHCLATAILGQKCGLEVHLILFPQPVTEHVLANLLRMVDAGAHLHLGSDYAALPELSRQVTEQCGKVYEIPPGGSSVIGALGFVKAGLELAEQIKDGDLPAPERIYIAAGTCGSLAGLWTGLRLSGVKTRIFGVRVVDEVVCNELRILGLIKDLCRLLGVRHGAGSLEERNIVILDEYIGPGYGFPLNDSVQIRSEFTGLTGIELDETYTEKTVAAFLDYLADGGRERCLYWHTLSGILPPCRICRDSEKIPAQFRPFFNIDTGFSGQDYCTSQ